MAADVDYVVDTAADPVEAICIAMSSVTSELYKISRRFHDR